MEDVVNLVWQKMAILTFVNQNKTNLRLKNSIKIKICKNKMV